MNKSHINLPLFFPFLFFTVWHWLHWKCPHGNKCSVKQDISSSFYFSSSTRVSKNRLELHLKKLVKHTDSYTELQILFVISLACCSKPEGRHVSSAHTCAMLYNEDHFTTILTYTIPCFCCVYIFLPVLNKGQCVTKYYRWMQKNGGYIWIQSSATIAVNAKNASEKNIIWVNYLLR